MKVVKRIDIIARPQQGFGDGNSQYRIVSKGALWNEKWKILRLGTRFMDGADHVASNAPSILASSAAEL